MAECSSTGRAASIVPRVPRRHIKTQVAQVSQGAASEPTTNFKELRNWEASAGPVVRERPSALPQRMLWCAARGRGCTTARVPMCCPPACAQVDEGAREADTHVYVQPQSTGQAATLRSIVFVTSEVGRARDQGTGPPCSGRERGGARCAARKLPGRPGVLPPEACAQGSAACCSDPCLHGTCTRFRMQRPTHTQRAHGSTPAPPPARTTPAPLAPCPSRALLTPPRPLAPPLLHPKPANPSESMLFAFIAGRALQQDGRAGRRDGRAAALARGARAPRDGRHAALQQLRLRD